MDQTHPIRDRGRRSEARVRAARERARRCSRPRTGSIISSSTGRARPGSTGSALLSAHHRLYRYDHPRQRACPTGVATPIISFATQVADLELIADSAGLDRFALLGISQGAAIAIEYAARHPERVSHLVHPRRLLAGAGLAAVPDSLRMGRALAELMRLGWGIEPSAFRRMFAELLIPQATEEQVSWFSELQRRTTTRRDRRADPRGHRRHRRASNA